LVWVELYINFISRKQDDRAWVGLIGVKIGARRKNDLSGYTTFRELLN